MRLGAEGLSLGGVLSCLGKGSRRGCGIGNGCFEPQMAREGVAGGVFGIGIAVFEPGRPSGRCHGIRNDCFEPEMALEGGSGGVFGIGIAVFEPGRLSTRAETPVAENETQPEQGRQTAQSEESVFIENLSALIREAMDSGKVDFEEIASRMCISRTHLNRKVKAITGGTTSDLVLSLRIAKAKELLLTTDLPVWEVAEKCGISDPAYFSTLFKKAVGKSPGQLRKDQD